MPLKAIAFDAYGTLFDVYSVSSMAEELFPGKGAQLAALWRDKQIEYTVKPVGKRRRRIQNRVQRLHDRSIASAIANEDHTEALAGFDQDMPHPGVLFL